MSKTIVRQLGLPDPNGPEEAYGSLCRIPVLLIHGLFIRLYLSFAAVFAAPFLLVRTAAAFAAWKPRSNRWPGIDPSGLAVPAYWADYSADTGYEFTLLKGPAGFYQVELAPIYERTRRFYRNRET